MIAFAAYLAGIWTAIILAVISPFLIRGYRRGVFRRTRTPALDCPTLASTEIGRTTGGAVSNGGPVFSQNHDATRFHEDV